MNFYDKNKAVIFLEARRPVLTTFWTKLLNLIEIVYEMKV